MSSNPPSARTDRDSAPSILIIRRDNIGDLVCTTPMFHALREHLPDARICALVNSYNSAVLDGNPDIDEVFFYTKAKHRQAGQSLITVYLERLRLFLRLRRERFDYAILAGPSFQPRSLRLARRLKARHIIGFTETPRQAAQIDGAIPYGPPQLLHETEDIFRLLAPFGINPPPPAVCVVPADKAQQQARQALQTQGIVTPTLLTAVHISARKPSQRWPAQRFIDLIKELHQAYGASFMLLWSPGDDANPLHPGDDGKAKEIIKGLAGIPVLAYPTHQLGQLIGALSLCDVVVCSDGGAMHLAAGLNKPILCFFGKSDARRWHPWGVPHILLQSTSLDVVDISVDMASSAFKKLLATRHLYPMTLCESA